MSSFLQRYNVGHRLGGAFGLLILLSCLLVAGGLLSMSNARRELDNIVKVNFEKSRISNGMLDANSSILVALGTLAMVTREELNAPALAAIKENRQRYNDLRKELDTFPADNERVVKLRADIDAGRDASRAMNNQVIELSLADRNAEAQTLLSERARPTTQAWQSKIRENAQLQEAQMKVAYANKSRISNGMLDANSSILVALGTLAMVTREELNAPALAAIKENRQRYNDLRKELDTFPADNERVVKLRADIDAGRDASRAMNNQVIELSLADRNAEAQTLLSERARPTTQAWQSKIRENAQLQEAQMKVAYANAGESGDGQWSQHAHCRWRGGTGHQQSAGLGDHPQPH
ncbi:MCP four helix bundle domain-containing protein [Xanthomonas sp. MUS 060]|uniref:MCP four helix bundle domain-containing protein n=1 Tax=Xanthomonas sp. MUS 060 TaxID=1588031 RepID=UPI0006968F2E|nr:MCP four helix bundle domain-containing protein [Xanthomonas sp. MUS 060]